MKQLHRADASHRRSSASPAAGTTVASMNGNASALPITARLLIHAEKSADGSPLMSALRRIGARRSGDVHPASRAALRLRIEDLRGRRAADIEDAGTLTDLSLTPGTYVVTATTGHIRRRYTLTLEPGLSFDLYLHFVPE
jgi:hypothetical protein